MKTAEDLSELSARLEALEEAVDADIEDVRERVIQVKREADAKAPADHEHPDLAGDLAALETAVASLEDDLDRTERRLEGGFDNFEEILEELFDRTETVEADLDAIGQALQSMRETVATVARRERRRARADHLKGIATKRGVRTANCENCNATVDVALLSEAVCPTCGEPFHSLDANPGFFGTSILETGEPPALEGETVSPPDLEEVGRGSGQTDFNWQSGERR